MAYTFQNPFTKIDTFSVQGNFQETSCDILFLLVMNGELQIQLEHQLFTMGQGDLIMILPDTTYSISGSGSNIVLLFRMRSDFFSLGQPLHIGNYICNSVTDIERDYTPLRSLLSQIALNARYDSNLRQIKTAELSYSLLFYLNSYHYTANIPANSKYDERKVIILSYLEKHYRNPITLEDVAALTYLTPTYLSRFFKNHMGGNFNKILRDIRLKHATTELLSSDSKIIDIAINNGFSSVAGFNKSFYQKYQMSPKQYRIKEITSGTSQTDTFSLQPAAFDIAEMQLQSFAQMPENTGDILYPSQEKYIVKDIQKSHTITPIWKQAINIGFIDSLENSSIHEHLTIAQREIGFHYGRIQGIMNKNNLPTLKNGQLNFSLFDRSIQMLLSTGLTPYLDLTERHQYIFLSEMQAIYKDSKPQKNDANFSIYISHLSALIRHCINTFGFSQVESWIFEIGCSHDAYLNTMESPAEFARRFATGYRFIKSCLPNAEVGGIVYNPTSGDETFELILTELEKQQVCPDFISISIFPYEHHKTGHALVTAADLTLSPDPDFALHQISMIRAKLSAHPFFNHKLFVSTIGTDIQIRNLINDTCFQATYFMKSTLNLIGQADLIAYWQLSDICSEYSDIYQPLFGGTGLISKNGIYKPGFIALKHLSSFPNQLVQRGQNYMICSNSINSYHIILYNFVNLRKEFCYEKKYETSPETVYSAFCDAPTKDTTFYLNHLIPGRYKIITTSLNRKYGSLFDSWIRYGIFDDIHPEDLTYLKEDVHPQVQAYYQDCPDGTMSIHLQLLPHEVKFCQITREL